VLANILNSLLDKKSLLEQSARPIPSGASGIGAWATCLEAFVHICTLTNVCVVVFTDRSDLFGRSMSFQDRLIFYIVASHLLFFLKWVLATLIPDTTFSTRLQLKRAEYLKDKHVLEKEDAVASCMEESAEGELSRPASDRMSHWAGQQGIGHIFDSYSSIASGKPASSGV
jgi:hypothetical protein